MNRMIEMVRYNWLLGTVVAVQLALLGLIYSLYANL